MNHRRSCLALVHSVSLKKDSEVVVSMRKFSSNKFSKIYLTKYISPNVKVRELRHTQAYFDLIDKINQVVAYINSNGGFTVIGWFKRGTINDKAFTSNDQTNNNRNPDGENIVDSSDLNYHIVDIHPSNKDFDDHLSNVSRNLQGLKFDVDSKLGEA